MPSKFFSLVIVGLLGLTALGCGGETGGVTLAHATGIIVYNDAPIADARIMAIPEKGPVAVGISDAEGKFTFSTGSRSGVAVGQIKVGVTLAEAESSETESETVSTSSDPQAASSMTNIMKKRFDAEKNKKSKKDSSPLAKYADPAKSGLFYQIKAGSNELKIVLK